MKTAALLGLIGQCPQNVCGDRLMLRFADALDTVRLMKHRTSRCCQPDEDDNDRGVDNAFHPGRKARIS